MSDYREQLEFDLTQARKRAEDGIQSVGQRNASWLELARSVARQIADERGTVTADDVRRVLYADGHRPNHYNAWGAVFRRGSGLRWTGRYHTSRVVIGHGNQQRIWELDR